MEELLKLDDNNFISIVCFSNQTRISENLRNEIVQLDYLVSAIGIYKNIILKENLDVIYNMIVNLNIKDNKVRRNHIKNIKTKIKMDNDKINNMI